MVGIFDQQSQSALAQRSAARGLAGALGAGCVGDGYGADVLQYRRQMASQHEAFERMLGRNKDPIAKKHQTIKEELQAETDEWLRDVAI